MPKIGKKFTSAAARIDRAKKYALGEALELVRQLKFTKFNESVDIAVRLGVDPRKGDQMVRGAVSLPNGTGKSVRVLVFAEGPAAAEAKDAGADHVGGVELVEKVGTGWLEFDKVIATPGMMKHVGKIGKVLGPHGLMPNPKVGTVTDATGAAVRELKAGRIEFRADKTGGIVHAAIGKTSMTADQLRVNAEALLEGIQKAKPATAKGTYLKSISVSSTMGPGIKVDTLPFAATAA